MENLKFVKKKKLWLEIGSEFKGVCHQAWLIIWVPSLELSLLKEERKNSGSYPLTSTLPWKTGRTYTYRNKKVIKKKKSLDDEFRKTEMKDTRRKENSK